ncbi:hypothetical protein [Streptomyces prunicolor]
MSTAGRPGPLPSAEPDNAGAGLCSAARAASMTSIAVVSAARCPDVRGNDR